MPNQGLFILAYQNRITYSYAPIRLLIRHAKIGPLAATAVTRLMASYEQKQGETIKIGLVCPKASSIMLRGQATEVTTAQEGESMESYDSLRAVSTPRPQQTPHYAIVFLFFFGACSLALAFPELQ